MSVTTPVTVALISCRCDTAKLVESTSSMASSAWARNDRRKFFGLVPYVEYSSPKSVGMKSCDTAPAGLLAGALLTACADILVPNSIDLNQRQRFQKSTGSDNSSHQSGSLKLVKNRSKEGAHLAEKLLLGRRLLR